MSRDARKSSPQRSQSAARELLANFYTVERAGGFRLSDGGGPFGFDITTALQVDFLMASYGCDGIVETGSFLGDTTTYLARQYPDTPIRTCDVSEEYASFTRRRLAGQDNVRVLTGSSDQLLPRLLKNFSRPLVYLDAHWYEHWPIREEIALTGTGIVAIDDFDIGHRRFSFDEYDGTRLDARLIARVLPELDELFVGDPEADYPFPCLQTGRRSGTAYLVRGLDPGPLRESGMFRRIALKPHIQLPSWNTAGAGAALPGATASRAGR
ncbi:hypothetical protein QQM39_45370 [Streptomyces sp. DT2A-34]|uniref:hypothetical protein n=1 Tax=Streptomyces sp. DT2A-34 TaxID=3051182 RepID=UPI00265C1EA3|nr:hypothetical protein [Streptomyces sp. DT2A-34]MDO0917759.1 hypothetical protein [Streptomyces sp. DT2A-34]